MKKILFFAIYMMALALNVNAQTAKIALQHKGNVTMYASDAMKTVMEAAVDGDTIYLNEGNFISDFSVNKKVSVIGAGQLSKITGNVSIAIPNNPNLTSIVLDGLNITGILQFTAPMDNVKIRKCKFGKTSFTANVSNVVLDRCFLAGELIISNYVKSMTVLNSKIKYLRGSGLTGDAASFINCNIFQISTQYNKSAFYSNSFPFKGVIINSIIFSKEWTYSSSGPDFTYLCPDVTLVNCLLYNGYYDEYTTCSVNQNCMSTKGISYSGDLINSSTIECAMSNEILQSNNILGNDGKIVGIYGGATPFSLIPTVPTVTSSKIVVDTQNNKLNVDIKVTSN